MGRRVVVTGMGAVSPLGLDLPTMWQRLVNGESGVDYITAFDASELDTKIAAEVKGFDPLQYFEPKEARRMDRFTQFAIVASMEAVKQASLKINNSNEYDVGVIIGNNKGGIITLCHQLEVFSQRGPRRVSPFLIPMMMVNRAAAQVSISLGAKGCNFGTASACASGASAIGEAFHVIKRGDAKVMITGGCEATIVPIIVAAFNSMNVLSTRNNEPQRASRPFDAERDGFVLAEGGAVMILEDREHAQQRGVPILAELIGYGATADACHISEPAEGGEGAARSMLQALRCAQMRPEEIDYINAHGTATPLGDKQETLAIKAAFKEYASRVPVSSTKSMIGHMISAAGAIEAIICIMAIRDGIIPPTINLEHPDPECDLDYVPNVARKANVRTALSNSFGFGGHNTSLIFVRHD